MPPGACCYPAIPSFSETHFHGIKAGFPPLKHICYRTGQARSPQSQYTLHLGKQLGHSGPVPCLGYQGSLELQGPPLGACETAFSCGFEPGSESVGRGWRAARERTPRGSLPLGKLPLFVSECGSPLCPRQSPAPPLPSRVAMPLCCHQEAVAEVKLLMKPRPDPPRSSILQCTRGRQPWEPRVARVGPAAIVLSSVSGSGQCYLNPFTLIKKPSWGSGQNLGE